MTRSAQNVGRPMAAGSGAIIALLFTALLLALQPAGAQTPPPGEPGIYVPPGASGGAQQPYGGSQPPRTVNPGQGGFSSTEIIGAGHQFFGRVSTDLASAVEYVFARYGEPTAYIAGEEASGAVFAGARYGEGTLHMRFGGSQQVFWQGPSLGFDIGGDGSRVMVLVYGLPDMQSIFDTFGSTSGVAYVAGGLGVTFQSNERNVRLAVIQSGVGLRLGINLGYVKYTAEPTWNPF